MELSKGVAAPAALESDETVAHTINESPCAVMMLENGAVEVKSASSADDDDYFADAAIWMWAERVELSNRESQVQSNLESSYCS